jgi:hypothetical protein
MAEMIIGHDIQKKAFICDSGSVQKPGQDSRHGELTSRSAKLDGVLTPFTLLEEAMSR